MALKERLERTTETRAWFGDLPVESLYTVGIAAERFFRTLKEQGRFTGTRCERCGVVYVPARLFCERCLDRLEKWVNVSSTGTLESWTMLHVGLDGKRLAEPVPVGLVRLEGADTCIIHRLAPTAGQQLSIGMKVTAVLKPKTKRTGAITDILHFKPE